MGTPKSFPKVVRVCKYSKSEMLRFHLVQQHNWKWATRLPCGAGKSSGLLWTRAWHCKVKISEWLSDEGAWAWLCGWCVEQAGLARKKELQKGVHPPENMSNHPDACGGLTARGKSYATLRAYFALSGAFSYMNKFPDGIFRTDTSVISSTEISEMSDGSWE